MTGRTVANGYGAAHKRLRAHWAPTVATGTVQCWRCRELIPPGAPWDLGHTDDRTAYNGPEHRQCNRNANPWGRWRKRQAKATPPTQPRRQW